MNSKNIRDLIVDESDLDIHPFAREQEEQEPEVIVLSNETLLERRKQEIAPTEWW